MKNKTVLIYVTLLAAIVALLVWARAESKPQDRAGFFWPGTNISCLVFGHQNLQQHIHPTLTVTVDGIKEPIPANVGISQSCMAELHTHDGTGELHIESLTPEKTFTIFDFFTIRGQSIDRDGYTYDFYVNGKKTDSNTYKFADLDQVEVRYTSIGKKPIEATTTTDSGFDLKI